MDLSDKNCVVTGAAGGIGSAVARRFAAEGARGVVVADVNEAGAEAVAAGIRDSGGKAVAVVADIGTEAGNVALIKAADDAFGPVDVFHANAGVGVGRGLEAPDEGWDLLWRVNV